MQFLYYLHKKYLKIKYLLEGKRREEGRKGKGKKAVEGREGREEKRNKMEERKDEREGWKEGGGTAILPWQKTYTLDRENVI